MAITGQHFIGGERSALGQQTFCARNSATGEELVPRFTEATVEEVDSSLRLADRAFDELQHLDSEKIAALLDEIAIGLERGGEPLLARAHVETALPRPRLEGECARTVNQTRMFAQLVRDGGWVQARIDRGDSQRKP